jgi:hypothetical protein
MEVVDQSLSITNIIDGFPCAITGGIAQPINEIIQLVAHNFRIENGGYLVLRAVSKLEGRWGRHDTIGNRVGVTRLQKRAMKDGMKP